MPGFLQRTLRNSLHPPIVAQDVLPFPTDLLTKLCFHVNLDQDLTRRSQASQSFSAKKQSDFAPIRFIASIQNISLSSTNSFNAEMRSFFSRPRTRCLAQCLNTYRNVGENVLSMQASSPGTSQSSKYDDGRLHMLKQRWSFMTEKHRLAMTP